MGKIGFDAEKYLTEQAKYIRERIKDGDGRLYLEFGGKLVQDKHAMRVLPGFDENAKIKLLHKMKDQTENIICIYAGDIISSKTRQDFGITYDLEVMRLIDAFRSYELEINSVVVTRYEDAPSVNMFINKLERRGIRTYKHYYTKGYPTDVDTIVSDEGYGANPYIEVTKPLIVVTGPGGGSGKLATSLSQVYHEYRRGTKARYAKFETFPIWNLPLKHPVNIAYEAATADLKDVNMIDPFHLEAYGETAVNYNRDIDAFPVLKRILALSTMRSAVRQRSRRSSAVISWQRSLIRRARRMRPSSSASSSSWRRSVRRSMTARWSSRRRNMRRRSARSSAMTISSRQPLSFRTAASSRAAARRVWSLRRR